MEGSDSGPLRLVGSRAWGTWRRSLLLRRPTEGLATVWACPVGLLSPCLDSLATSTGFDLWILTGFHFLTHLCSDWQLSDMRHPLSWFLLFLQELPFIHGIWSVLEWMGSLKRPTPSLRPKKRSRFCFWWGWSGWSERFAQFWDLN